jgi:hypothetical protein
LAKEVRVVALIHPVAMSLVAVAVVAAITVAVAVEQTPNSMA